MTLGGAKNMVWEEKASGEVRHSCEKVGWCERWMERARETGALYCGRHTTLRRTLPESIIGNVFFSFFIMTSSSYLCGAASEARERRWTVHFFSPWLSRVPSPRLLYFWSCRGRSTRCLGWRSSSPWHRWGAPRCCTKSTRSSASPRKASCSSTSPPRLPLNPRLTREY